MYIFNKYACNSLLKHDDLETERQRIQREIEALENTLGANAALADVLQGNNIILNKSQNESSSQINLHILHGHLCWN